MLNGKHILIENCPGMGDLIMCTPAFKRLKELYPDCVLSVVSYAHNLDIIAGLPYIDHVYGIAKGKFLGHFRPALHFRKQDYVIFTSWQPQLARMAQLLRVPHRAGVCKEKYRGTGLFHQELPMHDFRDTKYRADFITEQISLALGVDLSNDGVCEVAQPDEESIKNIEQLLSAKGVELGKKYIVIAPFGKTEKNIPLPLIREVVEFLEDKCDIYFTDSQIENCLQTFNKYNNVHNLCGKTSLSEMMVLFQNAQFVITTNSAPLHISCALHKETICLFTRGSYRTWAPRKYCLVVTLAKKCAPCDSETEKKCFHQECVNGIKFDMLKLHIEKLMDRRITSA